MTRIIAIANQKGGVGKTTTVINLGASLAVNDREVLLVDLDPQANATGGFGMSGEEGPGIAELLLGRAGIEEVIRRTELDGLYIIPGSKELAGLEIELASTEYREFVLAEAVEKGLERFDYVLIDCPPSLGLLTLNALVAATEVLVAMQSEFYALEGLTHLLRTVRNVRSLWNPGLKINGVLLTMYDGRLRLNREVADEVEGHLGGALYETRIPRNVKLSEAPSYGKPVLLYDARSTGALSYLELAREVLKR
jgi:chromosome partitioning protein